MTRPVLRTMFPRLSAGLQSLAFKNVAMFVVVSIALVVPITMTYVNTVEELLTDTLSAEVSLVAQRSASLIDTSLLPGLVHRDQMETAAYQTLRASLRRIQVEFEVDNSVVMRHVDGSGYVYIADGRGRFALNEPVSLHEDFPETSPPSGGVLESGQKGQIGMDRDARTKWFQAFTPLMSDGQVVGLLLINKDATPVSDEIERLQGQILAGVALVLAVGIAIWGYFAIRLSRPLVNLRRASAQISQGNLAVDISSYGGADEVGELTRAFSQMVQDLRTSKEQVEAYTLLLQQEKDSFYRFVPTEFLHLLGRESPLAIQLGDASPRSMSVMFSDIRSFTTMSEFLEPEGVFGFLNEYLARMEPAIQKNRGFVNDFFGDGIMALFHDHEEGGPNSADAAADAAVEMRVQLTAYNRQRKARGQESVRIGIGIHTGSLVLGTVGSPHRLNTTVVGDTVNLSSRLEAMTTHYQAGIVVSDAVYEAMNDTRERDVREIAAVRVKGKSQVVTLYEVFGWEEQDVLALKRGCAPAFAAALGFYRLGRFVDARDAFREVAKHNPADRTAAGYVQRCEAHLIALPLEWEGVDVYLAK